MPGTLFNIFLKGTILGIKYFTGIVNNDSFAISSCSQKGESVPRTSTIHKVIKQPVLIGYSGKALGNFDSRYGSKLGATRNQKTLFKWTGAKSMVIIDAQGGASFIDLKDATVRHGITSHKCDGLITDNTDIALALFPADCTPLVIYSTHSPVVALIHVGRTGAEACIHTKAVKYLVSERKCDLQYLRFYLGLSIKQKSYFFDDIEDRQKQDPRWRGFIKHDGHKYCIDLVGRTVRDLNELGITDEQITICSIDVGAADTNYFSHSRSVRMAEPEGRNGFVVRPVYS